MNMIIKNCETCKNKFEVKNYRKDIAKYCSRDCRKTIKETICQNCGKGFYVWPSVLKKNAGKLCSQKCRKFGKEFQCNICNKKFYRSKAHIKNETPYCSRNCFSKSRIGQPVWNKGKRYWQITGKVHHMWKGDSVGYDALHDWVRRNLGRPDTCEFCEKTGLFGKKIHLANKSGNYKRDLNDWLRLCVKCHSLYDRSRKLKLKEQI